MAKSKTLQAVVEIAGTLSPTLASSIGEVTDKLGGINVKALAVGAAVGGIAVATTKAVFEAGKALVDLGGEFDSAYDNIRIGTGATGDALQDLQDDFKEVYKSVPTTMEDAGQAIADYNTRLGLTGPQLQEISKQAIQVSDMLGDDLGSVIEESSQAFQQWNIDADDMSGAMNYVFKASQSTGMGFTDLLSTVQQFGPQLQEMGYSFEESTALIGQLDKAGVNTGEVLGAMKKSVSALAKEGISASDGLAQYSEKIKGAKDMTEATTIASEIFGTKAASTMAKAIRDGTLSVDDLTKSLEDSQETIAGAAGDTYDFAERLQLFKQQAQVALEPLASTLFDSLNDLMPIVGETMEGIIPVIEQMSEAIIPIVKDLLPKIGPMLTQLVPPLVSMAGTIGSQLIPPIVEMVTSLIPVAIQLAQALLPLVSQIIDAVLPILIQLINMLLPIIMQIIDTVLPVLIQLINSLLPVVTMIIQSVLPIVVQILNTLTPILSMIISLLSPILELIMAVVQPILNLIMMAVQPLISVLSVLIEAALRPLQPIIQVLAQLFTGVLGGAMQSIQPIISAVQSIFQGLMNFITGVFTGNWSQAWSGVVQTLGGIFEGIIAVVKAPINAVIGLINGAIGALNKISVKIPDWVPGVGGQNFGVNIPTTSYLATGGFTDGISIAGEAGTEAVISFDRAYRADNIGYWKEAGRMLGVLDSNGIMKTDQTQSSLAGELLTLDDFSLSDLATQNQTIIYDFSGMSYSPTIQANGNADEASLMEQLRENEADFIDWLESWLRRREVTAYA